MSYWWRSANARDSSMEANASSWEAEERSSRPDELSHLLPNLPWKPPSHTLMSMDPTQLLTFNMVTEWSGSQKACSGQVMSVHGFRAFFHGAMLQSSKKCMCRQLILQILWQLAAPRIVGWIQMCKAYTLRNAIFKWRKLSGNINIQHPLSRDHSNPTRSDCFELLFMYHGICIFKVAL